MGNDYDSRRANKRLNKKAGREAAEKSDSRDKRQRVKGRPKVAISSSHVDMSLPRMNGITLHELPMIQ